jgi:hypothetical protein
MELNINGVNGVEHKWSKWSSYYILDYDWTLSIINFIGGIELSGFFSAQTAGGQCPQYILQG